MVISSPAGQHCNIVPLAAGEMAHRVNLELNSLTCPDLFFFFAPCSLRCSDAYVLEKPTGTHWASIDPITANLRKES